MRLDSPYLQFGQKLGAVSIAFVNRVAIIGDSGCFKSKKSQGGCSSQQVLPRAQALAGSVIHLLTRVYTWMTAKRCCRSSGYLFLSSVVLYCSLYTPTFLLKILFLEGRVFVVCVYS